MKCDAEHRQQRPREHQTGFEPAAERPSGQSQDAESVGSSTEDDIDRAAFHRFEKLKTWGSQLQVPWECQGGVKHRSDKLEQPEARAEAEVLRSAKEVIEKQPSSSAATAEESRSAAFMKSSNLRAVA